jgi:prepilin-type processing-associated H-X9-DG protein
LGSAAQNLHSIVNNANVKLINVTAGGGTTATLLLAHKTVLPANYTNPSGPNDTGGWPTDSNTNSNWDHMRWSDSNSGTIPGYVQDSSSSADNNHMGGPHPNGSPVLYADGSVSVYQYTWTSGGFTEDATWQLLWSYNRSTVVEACY